TMYSEAELKALGDVCVENELLVVSDEIYEHLVYGEERPVSMAAISPELKERTITINGVSKTYSMTGWRIGYAAGDARIIKAMSGLSSHSTSNPASVAQYAAMEALKGSQEPVKNMLAAFRQRRDFVVDRLQKMPGIYCN